jgi:hypothetical protein
MAESQNRFRRVISEISRNFGKSIPESVYSRKSLFSTLFSFIYDQIYGIQESIKFKTNDNSFGPFIKESNPKQLSEVAIIAVGVASTRIQGGDIDEDLAKVLRGATADRTSRETRLNFLKQAMKDAKEKLESR